MKKRINLYEMVFFLLLAIALLHSVVQLSMFNEGIGGFNANKISGFFIGEPKIGEELENERVWNTFSIVFVFLEWLIVGIFVLFLHFRNRSGIDREFEEVKNLVKVKGEGIETDLDKLYEVLKIRKTIRLSVISRVFDVSKEVAMDWCKTLEMGNFASIEYPRFGEPELVLEEKEEEMNNEK